MLSNPLAEFRWYRRLWGGKWAQVTGWWWGKRWVRAFVDGPYEELP